MQQDKQTKETEEQLQPFCCPTCGLELGEGLFVCPSDGTDLLAMPDVGHIFDGKYKFVDRIAEGGMGKVFKADQLGLNRTVAIKMPKLSSTSVNALRRFQQEAQALAKLDHPNLVKVYELAASKHGQPYTAMEYIEGKALDAVIKERGHLSLNQALNVFQQICDGLEYVHSQGILHRDLKPSNIMLINPNDENPKVKLVDFGIAKIIDTAGEKSLTQTGDVFGSPLYMSPEQAKCLVADERSDIYSLGCVMYESLTGIRPFSGQSIVEVIMKHLREKPRPINSVIRGSKYPNALEAIVQKTLEKEPLLRYQSVAEVSADLKRFADENRPWYQVAVPILSVGAPQRSLLSLGILVVVVVVIIAVNVWIHRTMEKEKFELELASVPLQDKSQTVSRFESDMMSKQLMDDESVRSVILNQKDYEELNLRKYIKPRDYPILKERKDNYITNLRADSHGINDGAIAYFQVYPLRKLDISGSDVTSASFPAIGRMSTLESLNISYLPLTVADFKDLAKLERLTELFATGTNLNDECMFWVVKHKKLRMLTLDNNPITDKSAMLMAQARLPLVRLSLAETRISDRGVQALSTLPIQDLDLTNTRITDACFPYLSKIKELRVLSIEDGRITDDGLAAFKPQGLLKLRILRLKLVNHIKNEAIKDFQKRTGCLVTTDGS